MALLASDVIERAREFHYDFWPETHPDSVLLSALRRAERRFFNAVSNIAPNALAQEKVFTASEIATAIQGTALTMPSYRMLLPTAVLTNENGVYAVAIVEDEESKGTNPAYIRVVGRSLYLSFSSTMQAEMDASLVTEIRAASEFKDADSLRVTYIPSPSSSLDYSDTLTAPDDSEEFLLAELVKFMVNRIPGMGQERVTLLSDAEMLQEDILNMYAARSCGETRWYVSEVG